MTRLTRILFVGASLLAVTGCVNTTIQHNGSVIRVQASRDVLLEATASAETLTLSLTSIANPAVVEAAAKGAAQGAATGLKGGL